MKWPFPLEAADYIALAAEKKHWHVIPASGSVLDYSGVEEGHTGVFFSTRSPVLTMPRVEYTIDAVRRYDTLNSFLEEVPIHSVYPGVRSVPQAREQRFSVPPQERGVIAMRLGRIVSIEDRALDKV